MPTYEYRVQVTTDTQEHADQVIQERIEVDEDYGFDYEIGIAAGTYSLGADS